MIYYKEARKLLYFMPIMGAEMFSIEEGKKIRKVLYRICTSDKQFKTKKEGQKLKIWRTR